MTYFDTIEQRRFTVTGVTKIINRFTYYVLFQGLCLRRLRTSGGFTGHSGSYCEVAPSTRGGALVKWNKVAVHFKRPNDKTRIAGLAVQNYGSIERVLGIRRTKSVKRSTAVDVDVKISKIGCKFRREITRNRFFSYSSNTLIANIYSTSEGGVAPHECDFNSCLVQCCTTVA